MSTNPTFQRNRILALLSPATLAALEPGLEPFELKLRHSCYEANEPIAHAYFLATGLGSVLIGPERTTGVEVGVVGRDGMIGLPLALGVDRSPHQCFIQVEGHGWRMPADKLTSAMAEFPDLRAIVLKYVNYFMHQLSATAYANADFTVEERLARWLLLCQDRLDGNDVALTHEFLALMLGVRRPGVTVATHVLEGEGMIRAKRGLITILDRDKLEHSAGTSYGVAEAEYARLLGGSLASQTPALRLVGA